MERLALKIPPLALWLICLGLMVLTTWLLPFAKWRWLAQQTWLLPVVGLIFITSFGVGISGVWAFKRARTTVNPLTPEKSSQVVTTGIYSYTRNPMYVGMALGLLGVFFLLKNLLALLFVPIFCLLLTYLQIKPEEKYLTKQFGAAYQTYCKQVKRWL